MSTIRKERPAAVRSCQELDDATERPRATPHAPSETNRDVAVDDRPDVEEIRAARGFLHVLADTIRGAFVERRAVAVLDSARCDGGTTQASELPVDACRRRLTDPVSLDLFAPDSESPAPTAC
jgi:hypothetical protein